MEYHVPVMEGIHLQIIRRIHYSLHRIITGYTLISYSVRFLGTICRYENLQAGGSVTFQRICPE